MSKCPFCSKDSLGERIILETDTLLMVSDAYPVVDGHMLILNKQHITSFGHARNKQRDEVCKLMQYLAPKFSSLGDELIFFEHGNMFENAGSNPSIDHAHIHVLPTSKKLGSFFPADRIIIDFRGLGNLVSKMSYYFFWEISSGLSFAGPDSDIESQFIRKIAGDDDWNWRIGNCLSRGMLKNTKLLRRLLV